MLWIGEYAFDTPSLYLPQETEGILFASLIDKVTKLMLKFNKIYPFPS